METNVCVNTPYALDIPNKVGKEKEKSKPSKNGRNKSGMKVGKRKHTSKKKKLSVSKQHSDILKEEPEVDKNKGVKPLEIVLQLLKEKKLIPHKILNDLNVGEDLSDALNLKEGSPCENLQYPITWKSLEAYLDWLKDCGDPMPTIGEQFRINSESFNDDKNDPLYCFNTFLWLKRKFPDGLRKILCGYVYYYITLIGDNSFELYYSTDILLNLDECIYTDPGDIIYIGHIDDEIPNYDCDLYSPTRELEKAGIPIDKIPFIASRIIFTTEEK
jgi:hypothetical protein